MIKMRDGRHLRCAHNISQDGHLPDYAPHPAKVDDETECVSFDLRPSDAINIVVRCKVPIQVNVFLAYSDGMKVVESAKPSFQGSSSDGLIFKELDIPSGHPCMETKEFNLIRNMLIAAAEERYRDAGVMDVLFLIYFMLEHEYKTEGLKRLQCRSLILVGENSPFHLESLHKTSKLDTRFSALIEVGRCGSLVTEEQPEAMLMPLEYFLMGYGVYLPSHLNISPRSPLSPNSPDLYKAESMGLKLKPIKTRLPPA